MSEYKYPLRMKSRQSGRVVEFTGLTTGTIISCGATDLYPVGHYSRDWFEHTNTDKWEYVGSPIWLQQKK